MKQHLCLASAAAFALSFVMPGVAAAQEVPLVAGDYVEVGMIKVDDGHNLEYANYLAGNWRKAQEYSKSQGWISNYEIWTNDYPRTGEADIWLITYSPALPNAAEAERRDKAYRAYMKQTVAQLESGSAGRAQYRHQMGGMLMHKQVWAKP